MSADAAALKGVKRTDAGRWFAKCPANPDRAPVAFSARDLVPRQNAMSAYRASTLKRIRRRRLAEKHRG